MILKNDSNAELARVIEELSARIDAIEGIPALFIPALVESAQPEPATEPAQPEGGQ